MMIYLLVRSLDSAVCYNKQACSTVAVKFFVRTFCLPALLLVMSQITQTFSVRFQVFSVKFSQRFCNDE